MSDKTNQSFDEFRSFLNLLIRSKDIGGGWRQVSEGLWAFVQAQASKNPAHFEIDAANRRIRFAKYE